MDVGTRNELCARVVAAGSRHLEIRPIEPGSGSRLGRVAPADVEAVLLVPVRAAGYLEALDAVGGDRVDAPLVGDVEGTPGARARESEKVGALRQRWVIGRGAVAGTADLPRRRVEGAV